MYIVKADYKVMDGEPQLGHITESALIIEDGEGLDVLIGEMEHQQSVEDTFYGQDEMTLDEIELRTLDYITSDQLDMLNAMFLEDNNWDLTQLTFILDSLRLK